jgi:adenosylhomocysteine nucleosidase
MIAVTFAVPAESSGFVRRLSNKSRSARNGIQTVLGKIDNREVAVLHTGVGKKACRHRLAKFLQDQQFDCLISAGFAGALTDELQVGDLLLAKNFSAIELNDKHSGFVRLRIQVADLLTVPELIDSSEERNETARKSGAAAVDMETEFIARICAEHGLPLLSLRVITDTPREPFPGPAQVLFDIEHQRTPMAALTMFFLTHPDRIPHLIQFARRIANARKTLANALVAILRE